MGVLFCPDQDTFRIDKSISKSYVKIFEAIPDSESSLMLSVLAFFCWKHQTDIFGAGSFSADEFAKLVGYKDARNLNKTHPSPYQLKGLSREKAEQLYGSESLMRSTEGRRTSTDIINPVWDSYLENILYVLNTCPVVLSINDHTSKYQKSILIIKEMSASVYRGKKTYRYVLDEDFMRNLSCFYNEVSFSAISKLKGANLVPLYLYLVNMRNDLGLNGLSETPLSKEMFGYLCELAGISYVKGDGTPYPFPMIKSRLNEALARIAAADESLMVRLVAKDNANGRNRGYFCLWFNECDAIVDPRKRAVHNKFNNREIKNREILRKMTDYFHSSCHLHGYEDTKEDFVRWFFSGDDMEEKKNAYYNAYISLYLKLPPDIETLYRNFKECVERNTSHDIDSLFTYCTL